jgi:chaperonin GroES
MVVEVGPGLVKDGKVIPLAVQKVSSAKTHSQGDKVLLPPFGGSNVKLGDQEYQLFKDSELLAKLQ